MLYPRPHRHLTSSEIAVKCLSFKELKKNALLHRQQRKEQVFDSFGDVKSERDQYNHAVFETVQPAFFKPFSHIELYCPVESDAAEHQILLVD